MAAAPSTIVAKDGKSGAKTGDIDGKTVGLKDFVVVRYDAAALDPRKKADGAVLWKAWRIQAASEDDAYLQMVRNDICFSLVSIIGFWAHLIYPDPDNRTFLTRIINEAPVAVRDQLVKSLNSPASMPRDWITPSIARRLWIIHNDSSDKGLQDYTPPDKRYSARLVAVDAIPATSPTSAIAPPTLL
jgi:hypothetical protein